MPKGRPGIQRSTFEDTLRRRTAQGDGGCLLWTGKLQRRRDGSSGYARLTNLAVGGKEVYVHRFAWERANGPIPAGMDVCHKCDVRHCVNVAHLFLGTRKDNIQDACRKGRMGKTLSQEIARQIRARVATGATDAELAQEYGCSRVMVGRIRRRQAWVYA